MSPTSKSTLKKKTTKFPGRAFGDVYKIYKIFAIISFKPFRYIGGIGTEASLYWYFTPKNT